MTHVQPRPRRTRTLGVLVALSLMGSACSSSDGGEEGDAGTTESGPTTTAAAATTTTPAEPPEVPDVAATLTFGQELGGESVDITKDDLNPALDAIAGSSGFIDLAYGGSLPADYASLVLTQKIILTVLAKRLELEGGTVDPIERVAVRGQLDQELESAVQPPNDAAQVSGEVSAYLDLIADLQATNTAVENALANSDSVVLVPCVRHILLDSEVEAQAVLEELEAGADFGDLARERSTGPTGPEGGDLGCGSSSSYVAEFMDAVDNAEIGSPVGPIQTQFGFHVLIVDRLEESSEDVADSVLDADLRAITVDVAPVLGFWDSTSLAVLASEE